MSLFQNNYGYNYNYGYQQPNPLQQLTNTINQGANQLTNSLNGFGQDMNRAWVDAIDPEPNPSVGRMASWAAGAFAGWQIAVSSASRNPVGLLLIAAAGVGAWLGNKAYDYWRYDLRYKL